MTREETLKIAGKRLAKGRAIARKKSPYITTTLYGLIFRPVWDRPKITMGVTPGLVCYFNPNWVVSDPELEGALGEEVMAGDIFHECWHIIFGMPRIANLVKRGLERGMTIDSAEYLANVAADMSINNMARIAGYKLQSWVFYPELYDLPPNQLMEKNWSDLLGEGAALQGRKERTKKGVGSGCCGGGAGSSQDKELEKELDEKHGRHASDRDRIRRTTVNDMKEHERLDRGSIPGFHEEDFDFEKERPRVKWESKFRHILTRCSGDIRSGEDDYCMSRVDKNSFLLGICLPGQIEEEVEVAFIRDTSASMDRKCLNAANNEIIHAMNALGASRVWFLDADVRVQGKPRRVTARDIPGIPAKGRGGTSFVRPLEEVSRLRPRPDVVVYLTDGDGTAPDKPPRGMHIIWCIVPGAYRNMTPAPWGHVVVCSNES